MGVRLLHSCTNKDKSPIKFNFGDSESEEEKAGSEKDSLARKQKGIETLSDVDVGYRKELDDDQRTEIHHVGPSSISGFNPKRIM